MVQNQITRASYNSPRRAGPSSNAGWLAEKSERKEEPVTTDKIYMDGIIFTKSTPLDNDDPDNPSNYPGFKQEIKTLPKGSVQKEGYAPLPCDIVFERDVAVKMRDGITIYVDVFRPATDEPVPVIIAWSPYGKNGSGAFDIEKMPGRMGVARESLSGLQAWEAPDPAYWCSKGYAVCNPDARGAFMSEGNIQYWGEQEGRDGHDLVEWLAVQPWCNGKAALAGNSWLAVCQWHIAAQQPSHLACIAPWEGGMQMYADDLVRGGIPTTEFCSDVIRQLYGNGYTENPPEMAKEHPLFDDYWRSKLPDLSKVEVPAYVVASWTSQVHTNGTFAGWRGIASNEKWLRVHNTQEWPDFYQDENKEDLLRFFDHYMKGADNGWEKTPAIRLSVLNPGGSDVVNRIEDSFPLERAEAVKLFVDAETEMLTREAPATEASASYETASSTSLLAFDYEFPEDAEVVGYPKARLWVEADGHDDMDLFVFVQKVGRDGEQLFHHTVHSDEQPWKDLFESGQVPSILYAGPNGRLRVSLRHVDEEASTEYEPKLTFDRIEKLQPGQIVPIDIPLWPTAMAFRAGEKLRFVVSAEDIYGVPLSQMSDMDEARSSNRGKHVFHAGGRYDSHLLIPLVTA